MLTRALSIWVNHQGLSSHNPLDTSLNGRNQGRRQAIRKFMSAHTNLDSGVIDPVAEDTEFKPIPEDQLIDAGSALTSEAEVASEHESNPQAENFKALREEVRLKKEKLDEMERLRNEDREYFQKQLEELKSSQRQHSQPEPKKQRIFEGMESDYVPSVGEIESALERHDRSIREQMEEMSVMQKYPDYHDVLQKDLVPLIKEKPHLAQMINSSPNKALAAYELGMMARSTKQSAPKDISGAERAQRIVQNSQKPMNVAQVGGSSAISKADYYASMSDADFLKLAQKNLSQI